MRFLTASFVFLPVLGTTIACGLEPTALPAADAQPRTTDAQAVAVHAPAVRVDTHRGARFPTRALGFRDSDVGEDAFGEAGIDEEPIVETEPPPDEPPPDDPPLEEQPPEDPFDPLASPVDVTLPFVMPISLAAEAPACFRFTIGITSTMSFGTSDGGGGCPGDTVVRIYDESGAFLQVDEDGGTTPPCARLDDTRDRGTFVFCVSSADGSAIDDIQLVTNVRERLFVSEVAAHATAPYVELFNTTRKPSTLVDVHVGGAAIPDFSVIPASAPFVVAQDAVAFEAAFGFAPDAVDPALVVDGTTTVELSYGGLLLDVHVPNVGYAGTSFERDVLVTTPQTEMDVAEWASAPFTPGVH